MSDPHHSFEFRRRHTIDALGLTAYEYRHRQTGAQHIHVQAEHQENVFLIAFRTIPTDSTGIAHILEHTTLCGSQKYPVRDPFFMMTRRSLNTFMNAMTSSDWTAYPFASQNAKDFDNLLSIYLDAVFFPRLDPLDFAQEGHRLEFTETNNSNSPLCYKGVVYNEMKGAMSAINAQLWHTISEHLFPSTTYHYNSGGNPEDIPKLSYAQLSAFYQRHYHPSNAIFMTFGSQSAQEHQARFEERALKHFQPQDTTLFVPSEKRFEQPKRVCASYAYTPAAGDLPDKQAHIVMAWLLDSSTELKSRLELQLLSSILFDNSASPLQHLLETSNLGDSPSDLSGADDSQLEMLFFCGLRGCHINSAEAFEQQVNERLQQLVKEGISDEIVTASLHQLELQQRELGGDHYPYGLQLLMGALPSAIHRGDALAAMDIEPALQYLRKQTQNANYLPQLIEKYLLNNPHRVTLTLCPDEQGQAKAQQREENALQRQQVALSDIQKQDIIDQTNALIKRQQQVDNPDVLPKVGLEDIPTTMHMATGQTQGLGSHQQVHFQASTNGLIYQQVICPLPELTTQELDALPIYSLCLTEVGINEDDYLSVQKRQAQQVGSFSAYYTLRNDINNDNDYHAYFVLSASGLNRNQAAMTQLMNDTLCHANFDHPQRLEELISQSKARREQSLTGRGHAYAMQAAAANCNTTASTLQQLQGLTSLQSLKKYQQQLQQGQHEGLIHTLKKIHKKIAHTTKTFLAVGEKDQLIAADALFKQHYAPLLLETSPSQLQLTCPEQTPIKQAWVISSNVNFCANAYPSVTMNHPDAAPLSVLAGVLQNGFLHRSIREQGGAYGGGATHDLNSGSFRFYSYRDPRMQATLMDFENSLKWLQEKNITEQQIEEAILNIISQMDKPGSPAGEAKFAFHSQFTGRNNQIRNLFRQRVIAVTAEDLYRVTDNYLRKEKASTVVITGSHGVEEAKALGLTLINL